MVVSSAWCQTKYEAWRQFNLEYAWRIKKAALDKFNWLKEPVVLEENGKFKVEGVVR